jgi:hypothetical protein
MNSLFDHEFVEQTKKDPCFVELYKYTYVGKGVSTNSYYNAGHWSARKKIKDKYCKILSELINHNPIDHEVDKFGLILTYNSRHDTDNVIGFSKIFIDVLKDIFGVIKEDNKHHYKLCASIPDLSLNNDTFVFNFIEYADNKK